MTLTELNTFSLYWIGLALVLVPLQLKIIAPYGRHSNSNWGWMIDNRWGWVLMELVSLLILGYFLWSSYSSFFSTVTLFIGSLWLLHYLNRSLIFPFRIKTTGKKMPLLIMFFAMFFNSINAGLNGYFLANFSQQYQEAWLQDPRFFVGLSIFLIGAIINIQADNQLLNLRQANEKGYKIPNGGLFQFISCPNHFGEIIEWTGFAILCWNLPALSFAIWTAANLIPRALAHHKWYQQYFANYPKNRKAVFPFVL